MPTDQTPPEHDFAPSYAAQTAWRLLHIDSDDVDSLKLKLLLRDCMPVESQVDTVASLEAGIELLHECDYDAVIWGIDETDARSLHAIKQLTDDLGETPVIVLSNDRNRQAAVAAGRSGASSFLLKSKLTSQQLLGALRQIFEQYNYEGELPDRRREPRYPLEVAAIVIPIDNNGKPGHEITAKTFDISLGGIVVEAQQDSELVPDICLVGVECPDGVYRYVTVEWRYRRLALPSIRFGGRFLRRSEDPLHPSKLSPRFDSREFRFLPALDAAVLHAWVSRGILQPRAIDRVFVCPQCSALPTFRHGCPQCGSADTGQNQLIHHFACANVAPANEYSGSPPVCPKCRVPDLVVGADFEYLNGPSKCNDCDWADGELELIAECLQCGHRFAGEQAVEKEVFEYHVERLDPLALIDRA